MPPRNDPKVLQIALKGSEIYQNSSRLFPLKTTLAAQASANRKYGSHLGNWINLLNDGLRDSIRRMRPASLLFMDNVKPEAINEACQILSEVGVKPHLFYRPYFSPDTTRPEPSSAQIEGYISDARIRLIAYLQYPHIKQAYEENRLHIKLFNETNIGTEGYLRGRAGFAAVVRDFTRAYRVLKAEFPKLLIGSPATTPGNDDVYFHSDAIGQPYWFHGPEAAKDNPSIVDILASIVSCPLKPVFDLADEIYFHTYANIVEGVSGPLAKWYSRRFEQYLKFLPANKKCWILEADMGYDNGQQARAELSVWWYKNVIDPNDKIAGVCHWWDAGPGEADPTWTKHMMRAENPYPIVQAIADYQGTTGNPVPVPEIPVPAPTTREVVGFPADVTPVRITEAGVNPGQEYWFAKKIEFVGEAASGGNHHIYILEPHDPNIKVRVNNTNTGETWDIALDKPANEPATNHPMFGIGNEYKVQLLGLPSDAVAGMYLPGNRHISYNITYEKRRKESGTMVDYPTAEWKPVVNYNSRGGRQIDGIVLHATAGGIQGAYGDSERIIQACLNWWNNPVAQASAHYLIGKNGRVIQCVKEIDRAWHAGESQYGGRSDFNTFTIGIELVNENDGLDPYPAAQLAAASALCKNIVSRYPINPQWFVTHQMISGYRGKTDPRGLDFTSFKNSVFNTTVPANWADRRRLESFRIIRLNPNAALQKRIFADGFVPVTTEYSVGNYIHQGAEHLSSGKVREYRVKSGDWGNVEFKEV